MSADSSYRFRWPELVALVFVGVVVVALVTPAIFAAREGARRVQCEDNLKRLSLGVMAYSDVYLQMPLGTVGSRELSPPERFSWYLPLWIFFEGKPPTLLVDTNRAWDAEANRNPRLRHVVDRFLPTEHTQDFPLCHLNLFSCPSASRDLRVRGIQATEYVGLAGLGKNAAELTVGEKGIGVWGYDRQVRIEDIKDGTTNTALLIETVYDVGPWIAGGPPTVRGFDSVDRFGGLHGEVIPAAMADASIRRLDFDVDVAALSALATIADED
jgi:hypothetical protein